MSIPAMQNSTIYKILNFTTYFYIIFISKISYSDYAKLRFNYEKLIIYGN